MKQRDGGGAEGSIDMDYWRSVHLHITGSFNQAVPITKNLTKCPENPMFRMQKPPQRCLSEGQFAGNNECHAFDCPQHVTGGKGGERWGGRGGVLPPNDVWCVYYIIGLTCINPNRRWGITGHMVVFTLRNTFVAWQCSQGFKHIRISRLHVWSEEERKQQERFS